MTETSENEKEKIVFCVNFFFPELPGGCADQTVRDVEAGDFDAAVSRAFKQVKKRKGVKGRRISQIKISAIKMKTATAN